MLESSNKEDYNTLKKSDNTETSQSKQQDSLIEIKASVKFVENYFRSEVKKSEATFRIQIASNVMAVFFSAGIAIWCCILGMWQIKNYEAVSTQILNGISNQVCWMFFAGLILFIGALIMIVIMWCEHQKLKKIEQNVQVV